MFRSIDQLEIEEISNKTMFLSVIEALLFVSGEPLSIREISSIIECDVSYTEQLLKELAEGYVSAERGIKLVRINNTYQLTTKASNSTYIQKLLKVNTRQSLSQAALETLAIIAYNQPITRIAIDEIRGVKSDRAIVSLMEKNLIKDTGRAEVPGRPILYSTTEEFLKHFGFEHLSDMPNINDIILRSSEDNGNAEKDEVEETYGSEGTEVSEETAVTEI